MAQPMPRHLQAPTREQQPTLDELLEEIFLRLPTAADLARAASACPSFRRVIAGHAFLRRFRALHPPPLLGIAGLPFIPTQPPHPSAAAARAFADANADFSCSFLPSPRRWRMADLRDGRALLAGALDGTTYPDGGYLPSTLLTDFAVCDPLHRRYLVLPVIPDDLTALVHQPDILHFDRFLAPPAAADDDGASFRVMCLAQCTTKLVLFVFSPSARQWRAVEFHDWLDLVAGSSDGNPASGSELFWSSGRHYAHGYFCWSVQPTNKLLMLHAGRTEFSAVDLPPPVREELCQMAFVEAAEGRIGMFTLYDNFDWERNDLVFHLSYAVLRTAGDSSNQWQWEATVFLPLTYRYAITGVAGGYLLLQGIPKCLHRRPLADRPEIDVFSLNLQTLQVERFCGIKHMMFQANLYVGFPPSLSAPTV